MTEHVVISQMILADFVDQLSRIGPEDKNQPIRKEVFYLTTHSTHLVTVIWRRTYDKGSFR